MTRWDPWRELRARNHIVFRFHRIAGLAGGAVHARRGDRVAIVVDPRLGPVERRAYLAHELVHDERGGGCDFEGMPPQWLAVVAREEARVERIVAERLVPATELRAFIASRLDTEGAVATADVAIHFEVPDSVAAAAMMALTLENSDADALTLVQPPDLCGES